MKLLFIMAIVCISGCSLYKANEVEYREIVLAGKELEKQLDDIEKSHMATVGEKDSQAASHAWRAVYRKIDEIKWRFERLQKPSLITESVNALLLQSFSSNPSRAPSP